VFGLVSVVAFNFENARRASGKLGGVAGVLVGAVIYNKETKHLK